MGRIVIRLLPLLGMLLWPFAAHAQANTYPSRNIRLVVPYAAGGIADVLARTVSQHLGPELGQTVVIENQTGAGGHLAASAVAKAPPDGYTLVLATIAHNAAAAIYPNLTYNPEKDLKPVIQIAESAGVLVVNASLPPKSVQEFIAYAKSGKQQLSYGSAGHGSAIHLAAELFKSMAAVDLVHAPYRGSAPAMTDLLSGHIQVMFENIPTALQHIRAGSIRPLGVTSSEALVPAARHAHHRGSGCSRLRGRAVVHDLGRIRRAGRHRPQAEQGDQRRGRASRPGPALERSGCRSPWAAHRRTPRNATPKRPAHGPRSSRPRGSGRSDRRAAPPHHFFRPALATTPLQRAFSLSM